MVGRELAAIPDGEMAFGLLASSNHLFAFFDRYFHRLLAKHVLPGLRGAHGEFGVTGVRGDDVDNIDVRVVGNFIEVFVGMDVLCWYVVFLWPVCFFVSVRG